MEIRCFIITPGGYDASEELTRYWEGLYAQQGYLDGRMIISSSRGPDIGENYEVDHVILWAGVIEYYLKLKE